MVSSKNDGSISLSDSRQRRVKSITFSFGIISPLIRMRSRKSARWGEVYKPIDPSFFELTMMMAFDWFASENVDIAVIEVGMGGRLDSTNIITPVLSAITNISFDHTQFLGDTLSKIALEKAGIMKPCVPCVIGEASSETETVFRNHAAATGATLKEAYNTPLLTSFTPDDEWGWQCSSPLIGDFHLPLAGEYQKKNIK